MSTRISALPSALTMRLGSFYFHYRINGPNGMISNAPSHEFSLALDDWAAAIAVANVAQFDATDTHLKEVLLEKSLETRHLVSNLALNQREVSPPGGLTILCRGPTVQALEFIMVVPSNHSSSFSPQRFVSHWWENICHHLVSALVHDVFWVQLSSILE